MSKGLFNCDECGFANGYHHHNCSRRFDAAPSTRTMGMTTHRANSIIGESIFTRLLTDIGEDPTRPGLLETPGRAARAWQEWTSGYHADPVAVLKTFEDGAEQCGDELVIVRDIEFYSHCEHHMAPFFGEAHVAYIPSGKIVGLSKMARLVDIFSKRLQVQERLTNQVADTIQDALQPIGVGVLMKATHMCMCSRGVGKQRSTTITSALRGALRDKPEARAEFMALVRS